MKNRTKLNITGFTVVILLLIICTVNLRCTNASLPETLLYDLDSTEVNSKLLFSKSVNVFYFFSPECPICLGYTLTLQTIDSTFKNKEINFNMIIPAAHVNLAIIKKFVYDYHIPCKVYADQAHAFIKKMDARVTPQVMVASDRGEILYTGLIDDYALAPGVTRQQVTKHYLTNVLSQLLAGQAPAISQTTPQGCYIEFE
ncbi:MAG: redoxin family protein [Bacteroidetes bacterium]|nr:redoxin family protein [Bacteroidota bacterium]